MPDKFFKVVLVDQAGRKTDWTFNAKSRASARARVTRYINQKGDVKQEGPLRDITTSLFDVLID